MSLVVAGLQHPGVLGDPDANLAALDEAASSARAAGADLLVTPEMFVSGYNVGADLPSLTPDDPVTPLADIARRHGIALVVGGPERMGPGRIANAAHVLGADGALLATYRKTHLFGELDTAMFAPGDTLCPVLTYRGVRLAVMICYDVEFPETVRAAALAGADAVLVPTAQMEPYAFIAEHLIRVRAWENQVYVVYVNRCGSEKDLDYVGRSSIAAPSGDVLSVAGADEPGLVMATVDPAVVRAAQEANPYLHDLRAELYAR